MSTLFIDDEDEARTSVLWANDELVMVEATGGTRRLDAERVTFKWLRRGDGPGEDMMTWDRGSEATTIVIVHAERHGTRPEAG